MASRKAHRRTGQSQRDRLNRHHQVGLWRESDSSGEDWLELSLAERAADHLRAWGQRQRDGDSRHLARWRGRGRQAARHQSSVRDSARQGPARPERAAGVGRERVERAAAMTRIGVCLWGVALAAACSSPPPPRPDNREAAYQENNRGVAELERYAYDKAVESFRRAIALDDRVALPYVNLPIALYYASDLEEAGRPAVAPDPKLPASPQVAFVRALLP